MSQPAPRTLAHPAFVTTHWSVVAAASDSSRQDGRGALARLCETYWHPLYAFVRRKGIGPDDALDLTQAFFEDFLQRNQVARADRARGRFRSFLVGSLENFLHNQWRRRSAVKRGGCRTWVSFDLYPEAVETAEEVVPGETPERAFARQWALTLLEQTQRALESEWAGTKRAALFHELLAHLWSDPASVPYSELSARFDLTPVNLRVTFHRFRQRYRDVLREIVAETVDDPSEIDEELRYLIRSVER